MLWLSFVFIVKKESRRKIFLFISSSRPSFRLSLIDDTMNSVQAGRISADVVMKMILGFKSEDSYTVWKTINSCFGKLNVILYDTECHGDFKKYVGDVMSLIVDTIGWEPKEGISL